MRMCDSPKLRSRSVNSNHTLTVKLKKLTGHFPLIIVYVKASKKHLDDFAYLTRRYQIDARPLDDCGLAYEVRGSMDVLDRVADWDCIHKWENSLDIKPPRSNTTIAPKKHVPLPEEIVIHRGRVNFPV